MDGMTMADDDDKKSKKELEEILEEARERYAIAADVDRDNRDNALKDTEFVWKKGAQWTDVDRKSRETDRRPCLEINQLPQFVKTIVNDQRQNRPGIRVVPADGEASEDTAEILQGLIRHIEYDSNAEAAYDSAFEHAVTGGRGYWRVLTDYESPASFNQKVLIKRVADPNTVRVDPDYLEPDASDIRWAFVDETLTEDEFKRKYPDAKPFSWDGSDDEQQWHPEENKVVVADYYRRVTTKRTLVLLKNGATGWKDDLEDVFEQGGAELTDDLIADEREAEDYAVEWYKLAGGQQILETYEWKGRYIPVVCCIGDEIVVNGKRIYQGAIRRAIDAQKLYNISRTAIAEHLALSPKSPWLMAEGQVGRYEAIWQSANKKAWDFLPYKPETVSGTVLPPPQRIQPATMPTGLAEQSMLSQQDLRSTIGIYDPSLGQRSNETSGRAIIAREKQGDQQTFHFHDNLSRAIAHTGRIILDLIPHIYDTERLIIARNEDDTQKTVPVNRPVPMIEGDEVQAIRENDLAVGRYAVQVKAGPSYATKRAEAAEFMMQVVQANPAIMQVAGDLIMKTQDVAGAEELAERLEMLLPPPVQQQIAAKKDGKEPPDPQMMAQVNAMQQQLQQAGQMMQQMKQENDDLKSGVAAKVKAAEVGAQVDMQKIEADKQVTLQKAEIDAAAKLEAAMIDSRTKLQIAGLNVTVDGAIEAASEMQVMIQQLAQGLQGLGQQLVEVQQRVAKPRRYRIVYDDQGEPLGAEQAPDDHEFQQRQMMPAGPMGNAMMGR